MLILISWNIVQTNTTSPESSMEIIQLECNLWKGPAEGWFKWKPRITYLNSLKTFENTTLLQRALTTWHLVSVSVYFLVFYALQWWVSMSLRASQPILISTLTDFVHQLRHIYINLCFLGSSCIFLLVFLFAFVLVIAVWPKGGLHFCCVHALQEAWRSHACPSQTKALQEVLADQWTCFGRYSFSR